MTVIYHHLTATGENMLTGHRMPGMQLVDVLRGYPLNHEIEVPEVTKELEEIVRNHAKL